MDKTNSSKSSQEKMQEKLLAYRNIESRLNSMLEKQNMFSSKILEIQGTIDSISEIGKGEDRDILFPLGSAAYTKGRIEKSGNIIVEIGAGVALEKTKEEAIEIMEKRKTEIQKAIEMIQGEIRNSSAMMQQIEAEAQEMMRKEQNDKFNVISS